MVRRLIIGIFLSVSLTITGIVLVPQFVAAATAAECTNQQSASIEFLPKWYKYLNVSFDAKTQSCNIDDDTNAFNGINFVKAIPAVLLAVFEIILHIAGLIAVMYVVVGGFMYLTATGEPDKAKNARTTIINALVGLVIALLSTAIVNLIGRSIK